MLSEVIDYSAPKRRYVPHITLGRINKLKWRRYSPEERPQINEEINLSFEAESIEMMESKLKRTGAEYHVLKSFSLFRD